MERRTLLRYCSAALAASATVGLAGCSDSGGDGNPTPDSGSVAENTVDGLEIVGWSGSTDQEDYVVTVTVRNTGDQTTDLFEYNYGLVVYDEEGTDISGDLTSTNDASEIGPGEEGTIDVANEVDGDSSAVTSYEIVLNCDAPFADGVYCE